MSLSGIVDVALGLILMYLLLSLLSTTVSEFLSTLLHLRAKSLSRTCTQLIDDPDVRKAFYNNGLIATTKTASAGGAPPQGRAVGVPAADAGATRKGFPKDKDHPSYIDGKTFAMALLASLGETRNAGAPLNGATFPAVAEIQGIVAKLPDSNIKDVLRASLATGGASVTELRDDVADAFDKAMDRLSGHFKRQMKWLSFGIGAVVALALNADSFHVTAQLWTDPVLRIRLAETALVAAKEKDPKTTCDLSDVADKVGCQARFLNDLQERVRPFPIGWSSDRLREVYSGSWQGILWNLLCKLGGLVLTAFAISLGAPFWFDIMQRFANIRGTGPKPATSPSK